MKMRSRFLPQKNFSERICHFIARHLKQDIRSWRLNDERIKGFSKKNCEILQCRFFVIRMLAIRSMKQLSKYITSYQPGLYFLLLSIYCFADITPSRRNTLRLSRDRCFFSQPSQVKIFDAIQLFFCVFPRLPIFYVG